MSSKRAVGLTVGLTAAAALGWSMYQIALATERGAATGITCPPDWIVFVLTAGIGVGVIATFFGGSLVFYALMLAIGLGALGGALSIEGEARTIMFILGGIFTPMAFLPLLISLATIGRRRKARYLLEHGTKAIGTVVSVRDTGVTVNMNPRGEMTLRIEPLDGSAPFEGSKTAIMSRLNLPYPGRRFPIWFDPADRTTFMIGADMDDTASPEHQHLFALAAQGNPPRPEATPAAGGAATVPAAPTVAEQLTQLNVLRLSGALTEEEFAQQKAKLLEG
jgi:hypothetical protein